MKSENDPYFGKFGKRDRHCCFSSVAGRRLTNSKFGVGARVGSVESEDDRGFGNARFEEFVGDARFSKVAMDPDFVVFDRQIGRAGKSTVVFLPAHLENLVAIALGVVNGMDFYAAIAQIRWKVVVEYALNDL